LPRSSSRSADALIGRESVYASFIVLSRSGHVLNQSENRGENRSSWLPGTLIYTS
jgi:hypothetical protein